MIDATKQKDMNKQLSGKHFLTLADFTKEELMYLIDLAMDLKAKQHSGEPHRLLEGKTLAMIFEKASTRTRVSFETGIYQLGGHGLFLSKDDIQLDNGESLSDTSKVLSRYVDGIMIRTFAHETLEELAENASIPVINGLTNEFHPCQVLADLMTMYEKVGDLNNKKMAFVGDGNNVADSLLMGCAIMGIDCTLAVPKGYETSDDIWQIVQEKANVSGATIKQTNDPHEAVKDANFIYTDVWTSMGWEEEAEDRSEKFAGYQVNEELVQSAADDFLFLHCLPAKRGEEVTAGIIDGPHSVVFDEAENRLHAQKAIMASIM